MTKEEAIQYLQQLYPNGGHCWLDEQRIEAIGMAINALQEEPVSEELEEAAHKYADIRMSNYETAFYAFMSGAKWKVAKLMENAIDVTVHIEAGCYPYIPQMELYDYDKDVPLAKAGDRYKVILIKEG